MVMQFSGGFSSGSAVENSPAVQETQETFLLGFLQFFPGALI